MTHRPFMFWLAVAAPIAAWTAQLLIAYFLVSLACSKGVVVPPAWHLTSILSAAVTAGALLVLIRMRREIAAGHSFVASIATLGAAVFLVGIVFGEMPLLLVRGCG